MKFTTAIPLALLCLPGLAYTQWGSASARAGVPSTPTDPYLWLEDITGDRALNWVRRQNGTSTNQLAHKPGFESLRQRLLAIADSREKIPYPEKLGVYYYNFWRDDQHVRGVWRRTSPEEYPKLKPNWETVLDLDQLAAAENENWVWKGSTTLYPERERGLIMLSRGGADASVVREFDLVKKAFVTNGFTLPEAKSLVTWRDRDTIYVGTDFGPGSLTASGYPRLAKEWKRGTPLSAARTIYEGKPDDVLIIANVDHDHGHTYETIVRGITFFSNETLIRQGDQWTKIDKPNDADFSTFNDQILITLRTDWRIGGKTYPAGALLAANLQSYLGGQREMAMLFEPGERRSLSSFSRTKGYLLMNELDNVKSRPYALRLEGAKWTRTRLQAPEFGNVWLSGVDADESDAFFRGVTDFLTPDSLELGMVGQDRLESLKKAPTFFDGTGLQITQRDAVSRDGTRIPYFQVNRKGIVLNGKNPTLLTAYGGFEISLTPYYDAEVGAAWLERGGVFVLANLRGGGEFGPSWHQAAVKGNRQRAYDDFIGVAQDLVARRVTSPRRLGIMGASNGGLLVGAALTQRPDLFRAVVCQVPLLDMQRFHKLAAGSSWISEYGDPDQPVDWAALSKYSPYQNVRKGVRYPKTLFTTSTRDDRVHPGHARKMMAKMSDQGHRVLYYENIEGGHAGAADNLQAAFMSALAYSFLIRELW